MIKYTCFKIKNKETFEDTPKFNVIVDTPKLNIVVDTSDKTINSLFPFSKYCLIKALRSSSNTLIFSCKIFFK